MTGRTETQTTVCCAHPYFGYVNTPNAVIDFSDRVPSEFGHGAVATIDANGFRNPGAESIKPTHEYWIGLFGGSVAFGVPASTDDHTISGYLERALQVARRDGQRVRVFNFAVPGGQQPQQLLMATLLCSRLDGVITFDGVNEVVVPSCYNLGSIPSEFPYLPYYSALHGRGVSDDQVVESTMLKRRQARFARWPRVVQIVLASWHANDVSRRRQRLMELQDSTPFQSTFPTTSSSAAEFAVRGADNWARHTRSLALFCRAVGIRSLHVVQPIPDRAKPLTTAERDRVAAQGEVVAVRDAGYSRLVQHADALAREGLPVEGFSAVFAERTEAIYTDLVHFEDRGSRIVAERLARRIAESWNGFER